MKKLLCILAIPLICYGCSDDGKISEKKINEAGDKLQKKVKQGADTIVAKVGRLKDSLIKDNK